MKRLSSAVLVVKNVGNAQGNVAVRCSLSIIPFDEGQRTQIADTPGHTRPVAHRPRNRHAFLPTSLGLFILTGRISIRTNIEQRTRYPDLIADLAPNFETLLRRLIALSRHLVAQAE